MFGKLKESTGSIKSFELISSKKNHDTEGLNQLELKYKVIFERISVEETFLIINDEGDLKIIFQNIRNFK